MSKKITTLNDYRGGGGRGGGRGAPLPVPKPHGDSDESSDSDSEPRDAQSFYVGGSERSGQEVLGPPRRGPDANNIVDRVMEEARAHGAEALSPEQIAAARSAKQSSSFGGRGQRLGDSLAPTTNNDAAAAAVQPVLRPEPEEQRVVLQMWRQGFTVDGGELRPYDRPDSQSFLSLVMGGKIPPELLRLYPNVVLSLDIENHHSEDYKPVFKPFAGTGLSLSGGQGASSAPPPSAPAPSAPNTEAAASVVKVDSSQPTTNIQIRLADGSRIVATLNRVNRVADIRSFIVAAREDYAVREFQLMTTFPNKILDDESKTLEEANLLNSVLVQKLVA